MATSIVIGGTRGMGSIISDHLSDRGDIVYVILSFLTLAKNNKVRKMIENMGQDNFRGSFLKIASKIL